MNDKDQVTIAMLKNLIANIEAGNTTTVDRAGKVICSETDTAELVLILRGEPDARL